MPGRVPDGEEEIGDTGETKNKVLITPHRGGNFLPYRCIINSDNALIKCVIVNVVNY